MCAFMYLYPENLPAGSMPKQKVYLIAGKSGQPDGNDEGTAISKYSSLGAPDLQSEAKGPICILKTVTS